MYNVFFELIRLGVSFMSLSTNRTTAIKKILSANDVGETGTHQAGMLIPKTDEILSFFPPLNRNTKNPRAILDFTDINNRLWRFVFIFYNNAFFGGTRNEYRLTHMTAYLQSYKLQSGDQIILKREIDGKLKIIHERMNYLSTKGKTLNPNTSWEKI